MTACKSQKSLLDTAAQINALTDAVNNSRTIEKKDSIVYLKGETTKDSLFTYATDTTNNLKTVEKNFFFYSHDTVKIISSNDALLQSARTVADLAKGELLGAQKEVNNMEEKFWIVFSVALLLSFVMGIVLYLTVKNKIV